MRTTQRFQVIRGALRLLLLGLALAAPLCAQTYEQVAPRPVREGTPTPVQPSPPAQPQNPGSDEILVPRLNGLRLIPSQDLVSSSPLPPGRMLVIDGLPWLDRSCAESAVAGFVSRPLGRQDLSRLIRALVLACRKSDRPVVDIYAPPQDVSTGVVQLVVRVARLGQVQVEGNRWFATDLIRSGVRTRPGQEITGQSLFEDVELLNQNPFRQVDLVYARGDGPGLTNVILRVGDQRPYRAYAGYDDSGNESTGLGRVFAGVNLGNLWGADQQFSYQYSRSTDFDRMQAHSASITVPVAWRDTFEVFGDWAEAKAQSGGILDLVGISWQLGARYTVPLPLLGTSYSESLNFGADYKWSNNNLAFGGTQVFTSPVDIVQGVLGYNATLADAMGSTQLAATGFYGPGGLGGQDHDRTFEVQRAGARAQFGYVQVGITRVQKLPRNFTTVLAILGQASSDRLLPSDQFGLGGEDSVRGYDERIINGDEGMSAQWEIRTPSWHVLGRIPDESQALVFVDAGRDWQRNPLPGDVDTTLASAGPGLRLSVGANGTVKADYGWQLERLPGTRHGRLHLSATLSF
jgi:hemolysin activation/secretion protein